MQTSEFNLCLPALFLMRILDEEDAEDTVYQAPAEKFAECVAGIS